MQKIPVLYFSLEMSGDRILAKSISRGLYKQEQNVNISAETLISGDLPLKEWESVEKVKQSAPVLDVVNHLHVCAKAVSASELLGKVKEFIDSGECKQGIKPLIIVDYLQILRPEASKAQSDKQNIDSSLKHLVELAHNVLGGLPVILISSLNRGSYNGPMQINAFKETGGIEYSADVLLGLQFQACHNDKANFSLERKRDTRKVEITVLKNRYGRSGEIVPLDYILAYDYFTESQKGVLGKEGKRRQGFTYTINNTKVATKIRQGGLGEKPCNVAKDIDVNYTLTTASLDTASPPLSCFDCCIADTLYTLPYGEGDTFLKKVWRVLTGAQVQNLTAAQKDMLNQSIEKLRNARLSIDCKPDLVNRRIMMDWKYDTPAPFLMTEGEKAIMSLYVYRESIEQMITFLSILLDVSEIGTGKGRKLGRRLPGNQKFPAS